MATQRIQLKRDTAANWTIANTILRVGEVGLETDTRRAKFGDWVSWWNSLSYAFSSTWWDMLKSENLSWLTDYSTARTNLWLNTTQNQNDSTDKRFMSDAQEAKLDAISWTNTWDEPNASTTVEGVVELATTAEINAWTDTTRVMVVDQYVASNRNVRYVLYRILDSTTNVTTWTTVGWDFEFPFNWTITEIGAYADTAGTTGTMIVDVNRNWSTLMTTNKLSFDSAEKTTRTAATPPTLTTTSISSWDLLTFDIDSIQSTPAKGMTIRIWIRLT